MSLPIVADFRLQGQLDALSTEDFETLKGLKREINTLFRKWSLRNNPENGGDAVVFNNVRDTKAELFKQIDLQEQRRWTLNLVKGGQEQKARHASRLASAFRRKLLQDRIIYQTGKNQGLVRLTARIVRSLAESSEAAATAFSDLRNFGLDDSAPISRVLDNDSSVSVLASGLELMLIQILDILGGGQSEAMHDGLKGTPSIKGTPSNQISTSIETYERIIRTIKAKEFQLANVHEQCQAPQKEIEELQKKNEELRLILQRTEGDLAAVTSSHFDVQSNLRRTEEELNKIKDCLAAQHSKSETDVFSGIRTFFSLKVPKLEAECDGLRREKEEIRRKLESKLREVNDEKIREIDKIKCNLDSQIQDFEDTITQLQQSLDDQTCAAGVEPQGQKAKHDLRVHLFTEKLKTIVDEMRAINKQVLGDNTAESKDKVEKEDAAKLGKTTNDSRKLVKGIVEQQAPNRGEPDKPISAVCGGNEEAAQVALLAVILDRMGCFGATVERMVSALQVDTGKKLKDEEVYPSICLGKGFCSERLCSFQVLALLRRHTTVFLLLVSPADHWAYRLARGLQGNIGNVAAASAPAP